MNEIRLFAALAQILPAALQRNEGLAGEFSIKLKSEGGRAQRIYSNNLN
jgi:hypothetical protein